MMLKCLVSNWGCPYHACMSDDCQYFEMPNVENVFGAPCDELSKNIQANLFQNKHILDVCCGTRMFWFDKENPDVLFMDIRNEEHILCDDRTVKINPDIIGDFTNIPFSDNSFKLVVYDPPHMIDLGKNSWMGKKYGVLPDNWKAVLRQGFKECFRVLGTYGILIFKWNESQIKVSEILELTDQKPLFGHKSGKLSNTHWICFMKTA